LLTTETAALIIHSCNKPQEKACYDTLHLHKTRILFLKFF
jgi:hypothetical protein